MPFPVDGPLEPNLSATVFEIFGPTYVNRGTNQQTLQIAIHSGRDNNEAKVNLRTICPKVTHWCKLETIKFSYQVHMSPKFIAGCQLFRIPLSRNPITSIYVVYAKRPTIPNQRSPLHYPIT